MPTLDEPLGPEDLTRIIEGIERADEIIRAINRATRVGIELDQQLYCQYGILLGLCLEFLQQ